MQPTKKASRLLAAFTIVCLVVAMCFINGDSNRTDAGVISIPVSGIDVGTIQYNFTVKYIDSDGNSIEEDETDSSTAAGSTYYPVIKYIPGETLSDGRYKEYNYAGYYYVDEVASYSSGALDDLLIYDPPYVTTQSTGGDASSGLGSYTIYMVYEVYYDGVPASSSNPSDPSDPSGTSSDPSDPSGTSSDPSDPSGTSSDPSDPSGTSSGSSDPSGTSSDPSDPSGTSSDPSDPSGTSSDPSDPSGTSSGSSDPSGTSSGSSDPSGTSSDPSDPSGTSSDPSDPSGTSSGSTDTSGTSSNRLTSEINLSDLESVASSSGSDSNQSPKTGDVLPITFVIIVIGSVLFVIVINKRNKNNAA